jgi:hypothetical protein
VAIKIKDRILNNYHEGIPYYDLMVKVFPEDQYPRAFEGRISGGPPGCAMAFGKALREAGLYRGHGDKIYRTKK